MTTNHEMSFLATILLCDDSFAVTRSLAKRTWFQLPKFYHRHALVCLRLGKRAPTFESGGIGCYQLCKNLSKMRFWKKRWEITS
jgi:hypothetical protein